MPVTPAPLLLASSSPRRRDLLAQIGVVPDAVHAPEIDETPRSGELPRAYAERLAREKAQAAAPHYPGHIVLAGDTTVSLGRRILPPAATPEDVARFLALLSGRRQRVFAGIAVMDTAGRLRSRVATSVVRFKRLTAAEIAAYAACGEGEGKAGGYAIQGRAAGFVAFISGSYSGVVGLPLFETRALLGAAGYPVPV